MTTTVLCAARRHHIDGIVFDKDGTLIDLDVAWGARARSWLDRIARDLSGTAAMLGSLADIIGLDGRRIVPGSVLAAGTSAQLIERIEAVLLDHGVVPPGDYIADVVESGAGRIVPIGDVAGTLRRLTGSGLRCGVLTSDDRLPTLADLQAIGASVHAVVCADDGHPPKPHPAGFLALAETLGLAASRLLMVGDSPSDREAAEAAGAAGFVRLDARGTSPEAIASIDEIELVR